jgi:hypothetical protein
MKTEKIRQYPIPLEDVDLSGRVKMETLEAVLLEQLSHDWCTPKRLNEETILGANLYQSEWRCISIRLLRYYRQGLLRRRRKGRTYEYQISEKGEDRLLYLWKKFKCLDPPIGWEFSGRLGRVHKELAEERRKLAISILEIQLERNKKLKKQLDINHLYSD